MENTSYNFINIINPENPEEGKHGTGLELDQTSSKPGWTKFSLNLDQVQIWFEPGLDQM